MNAFYRSRSFARKSLPLLVGVLILLTSFVDVRRTLFGQEQRSNLAQSISDLESDLSMLRGGAKVKDQLQLEELKRLAGVPARRASSSEVRQVKAIHQKLHAFGQDAKNRAIAQRAAFQSVQQNLDTYIAEFPVSALDKEKLRPMQEPANRGEREQLSSLIQSINLLEKDLSVLPQAIGLKAQLQLEELKRLAGIPAGRASPLEVSEVKTIHQKLHAFGQDPKYRAIAQRPAFQRVQQNLDTYIAGLPAAMLDKEKSGPMQDPAKRIGREQPAPLIQSIDLLEKELSGLPRAIGLKDQLQLEELKHLAGIPVGQASPIEVTQMKAIHLKLHVFGQDLRNRAIAQRPAFQRVQQNLDTYIAGLPATMLDKQKAALEGFKRNASRSAVRKRPIDDDPRGMTVQRKPDPAVLGLRKTSPFELVAPPFQTSGVFAMTNVQYFENTAQVIGPDPLLFPRGRVVVSAGQWAQGPASWVRDLVDDAGHFDASAVPVRWTFPITSMDELGTDNVLLKLKDGSLLAMRNGVTWRPLAVKPSWWDHVNVGTYPKGARVVTFVFRSTDGGEHWKEQTIIDPANIDGGRYAVPRPLTNSFGGWDRIEGYVDPWNGSVYLSCNAAGGPIVDYQTAATAVDSQNPSEIAKIENKILEPEAYTEFVFKSTDSGQTWQPILKFGACTPMVMTSTPNGRFYVFSLMEVGTPPDNFYQPILFYTLKNSEFSSGKAVHYNMKTSAGSVPLRVGVDPMFSHFVYKPTNSISRISTDATSSLVRLSYPWMNEHGRTAIAVINVEVQNDFADPVVTPVATFEAMSASSSVLASSFIDPDATGAANWKSNTSLLYWIEGSTDDTQDSYVRYSVFQGDSGYSPPAIIGGPSRPTVASGHYTYGGSYTASDGSLNFLPLWVEPGGIRANLVTVPPDPGAVRFNAVWTKAVGSRPAVWGWTPTDFNKKVIEMSMQGYGLEDLNAFVLPDGQGERYNAVWTKTKGERPFVAGWTKKDLDNRNMELSKLGFQLQRVNAFVLPGIQGERYNAIWAKTAEEHTAVWGLARTEFDKQMASMQSKGYQVKYVSGFCLSVDPEPRYNAVWTKINADRPVVWGYALEDFNTFANEMNAKGYVIMDLNTYILPGEQSERYNAVWAKISEVHHAVWGWSRFDFDREQVKWQKDGFILTEVNAYVRP